METNIWKQKKYPGTEITSMESADDPQDISGVSSLTSSPPHFTAPLAFSLVKNIYLNSYDASFLLINLLTKQAKHCAFCLLHFSFP